MPITDSIAVVPCAREAGASHKRGTIIRVHDDGLCFIQENHSRRRYVFSFDKIAGYCGQSPHELGLCTGRELRFLATAEQVKLVYVHPAAPQSQRPFFERVHRRLTATVSLRAVLACCGLLAAIALCHTEYAIKQPVNASGREVLTAAQLREGFDLGVNTSAGRTDWLSQTSDTLKMDYPSGQAWGAIFITVGSPNQSPRPAMDLSAYKTLMVELRGDPGSIVKVGIKDSTQPDDSTQPTVPIHLTAAWQTYAIPLSRFPGLDLRRVYVVTEFVFSGTASITASVRRIWYVQTHRGEASALPAPDQTEMLSGIVGPIARPEPSHVQPTKSP